MLFIRLHSQGIFINEIFWGLWLFPFGLLVFRSGFLPRFIGVWLMINCFGWVALSMTALFFPTYYEDRFQMVAAGLVWRIGDHAVASDQGRQGANCSRCASAGDELILSLELGR